MGCIVSKSVSSNVTPDKGSTSPNHSALNEVQIKSVEVRKNIKEAAEDNCKSSTVNEISGKEVTKKKSNAILKMSSKHGPSDKKGFVFSDKKLNLNLDTILAKSKSIKFQVLPAPIQSESDKKEYKVIKLENGLTACLIADNTPLNPESLEYESDSGSEESSGSTVSSEGSEQESDSDGTDNEMGGKTRKTSDEKMAAAGLCIGVGSFSDPKEVQGMAHFLEHMVFMGSEKFPEENDFDSFIKKGGGSDNASTDAETTCFYFECLEKNLYEAIDKFAQFFICPLMKKGAMTREREAIESEFQMALPSDDMRKEQILCGLAKPNSPVNSFGWGNLKTLKDNISDDKLYEGVHEFRKRHYSAHRMTLAVQARLPLDVLQAYVLDCFSSVPNNNLPPDNFSQFTNGIFDTPEFKKIYYIKPNTDLCQVDLTWSLPSLQAEYKSKPHHYVAQLMGDEAKGSLLAYLREKVWGLATSIGTGDSGSEYNSLYTLYTVTVVLTKEGFQHLFEVIETIFSYINMLKEIGPQQRIFDEMKMIADTSFKFFTEETAVEIVEDLSESMQFYPSEHYISGSELYYNYDPKGIEMVVDHLRPDKVNIRVLSKTLPNGLKYDKVEPWFGTRYTSIDIPPSWMKKWESVKPYPDFNIPPPNPYLTTDFTLLPDVSNNPEYPKKLLSTPLMELWFKKDQKFKLPMAYYYFYLISPLTIESAKSTAVLDIILNLLVVDITEELYPANAADLSYSFAVHEKGLSIKVSGYNQKLPLVTEVISKYIVTLNSRLTENMFVAVKDKVVKSYFNKLLKPSTLAKDIRLNLLVPNSWTPFHKHTALLGVTLKEVKQFLQVFIKSLYVKVLVQGNVSEKTASETVKNFVNNLQFGQLPENSYPKFRVIQVPKGEKCCRIQGFNENDTNSIITNYYQSGPFSIRNSVMIELIMLIIEEPLFDILRTKEQLGYSVYCSVRDTFGILGYTITVNAQANKFTTSHVDERIEAFVKYTQNLLLEMTEEELNVTKEDLIKTKQCVDVHLKEETDRNWTEIVSDDYLFDRLKQEIQMVSDIKIDELRDWWNKHNVFGNQENFRKLSIQVVGHKKDVDDMNVAETQFTGKDYGDSVATTRFTLPLLGSEEECKAENKAKNYFINDIEKFKEDKTLYPSTASVK